MSAPRRRERLGDDGSARHLREPALRALRDAIDQSRVGRDEDRLRELVVLGLREQVDRDPVGVGGAVRQHQDLRHARDHVDADGPEHATLGRRHIGVARTADLVDGGNRLRAVGERRDRLRPADRERGGHTGHVRGREHQRIARSMRRGHDHDDLAHTRHVRGNCVHQHRRRIGRLAAGHVDADAIERGHPLPELGAVVRAHAEPATALALVEIADPLRRDRQRVALGGRDRIPGFAHRVGADPQVRGLRDAKAVKACRVFEQRRITALAHVGDDRRHRGIDCGILAGLEGDQRVELGGEARRG